MLMLIILFLTLLASSTIMYFYLHFKTRMNLKFLYLDNLFVTAISCIISGSIYLYGISDTFDSYVRFIISLAIGGILVIGIGYAITMIRFWHTPIRKVTAKENEIVSPADGNVIYIKRIESGETPISIKNGMINEIVELTKTDLLSSPCQIIGINMTPWDVHKNCSPIDGKIILNKHTNGSFLSLKNFNAITQNERNTYVIKGNGYFVGVIQIASKGVRRIDSYVSADSTINKGSWLGMIRFGSQVDIILPYDCDIKIELGQQIYAARTIIATR